MKLKIPDAILSIDPYVPGKPMAALERELGIVDSIKLASNENPIGSSPLALDALQDALKKLNRYPDGGGYDLVHKLSEKLGVSPEKIVIGAGSDDIIGMLTPSPVFVTAVFMAGLVSADNGRSTNIVQRFYVCRDERR